MKNNFTRFPNNVFNYIISADLTATQYKIVLFVCRNTYGWNKDYCEVSPTELADLTGKSRRQIIRDINILVQQKILNEKKENNLKHMRFNEDMINS